MQNDLFENLLGKNAPHQPCPRPQQFLPSPGGRRGGAFGGRGLQAPPAPSSTAPPRPSRPWQARPPLPPARARYSNPECVFLQMIKSIQS